MVAVWIRAPDPGKPSLQVSALQVIMYYIINNWTKKVRSVSHSSLHRRRIVNSNNTLHPTETLV